MMSDLLPLECVVGSDFIENVVLYDRDDSPIRSYLGGETLAIELSTGDDQAPIPLTSSSVAWSDVTTGKLTITLTRADTATFTPGDYYLYLSITSAGIDQLILGLRKELGATFVVVTHELTSILTIADRCVMLDRGAYPDGGGMIALGDPRRLREEADHPVVRAFFRRQAVAR